MPDLDLLPLALAMAAVTYPARALPLLVPGIERLPPPALAYLRLVGPAVLGALVATGTFVASGAGGRPAFHLGIELPAVLAAVAVMRRTDNLLAAVALAAAIAALARLAGLAA